MKVSINIFFKGKPPCMKVPHYCAFKDLLLSPFLLRNNARCPVFAPKRTTPSILLNPLKPQANNSKQPQTTMTNPPTIDSPPAGESSESPAHQEPNDPQRLTQVPADSSNPMAEEQAAATDEKQSRQFQLDLNVDATNDSNGAEADSNFCIDDDDENQSEPVVSGQSAFKPAIDEHVDGAAKTGVSGNNNNITAAASSTLSQQSAKLPPRLVVKTNVSSSPIKLPKSQQDPASSSPIKSLKSPKEPQFKSSQQPQSQPLQQHEWHPFSDESLPSNNSNPPSSSLQNSDLTTLRHIFDTEYERAIEHQEISWRARYTATRLSFALSCACMLLYLWGGCMFYRSEAGWSVPDALLFTVYTVTTVGYGGPQPLPNTAAFHAFTSLYVLVGISGVTVLGAHTYQLITLEATRMRASKRRQQQQQLEEEESNDGLDEYDQDPAMERFRRQFMSELEDRVRERPALDRALDASIKRLKEAKHYMESTRSGRIFAVILPFVGMILLGALVVGLNEGWTPLGELM
jgi:hypothetical protein